MKCVGIILPAYLLIPVFLFAQAGSSCSNPYSLILDGQCRQYAISSSTSNSAICSYGSLHVTYFSFLDTSSQCVLVNVTDSTGQPCEVALYAGGTCTGGSLRSNSSMCLDDGNGIWAPALYVAGVLVSPPDLQSGTTYVLRVQTTSASGNITLCGQYYTPHDDQCLTATVIGSVPTNDNNACNTGGNSKGVIPNDLAAGTLENTAFYKFTVATTGPTTINFNNVDCDNGKDNSDGSNVGIQVGIFMGNCSLLTRIDRFTNNLSSDSRYFPSLTAGTDVYIAIDGVSGSNCSYSLSATNTLPLAVYIKYFTAWKTFSSTILKWLSLQEYNNDHYEIERSLNGTDFISIGSIQGGLAAYHENVYQFEDKNPPVKCFYRLKEVDINNRATYYKTIEVNRSEQPFIKLSFENPVIDNMHINLQTNIMGTADMSIIDMSGRLVRNEKITLYKGDNFLFRNFTSLLSGKYILSVVSDKAAITRTFVKMNSSVYFKN